MKKSFPIHPFLFAIFPVLALYSINKAEHSFSVTLLPMAISCGFVLLLVLLLRLALKDTKKSGVLVSVFLALFFSYGPILVWLTGGSWLDFLGGMSWLYLSILWATLLIICAYFIVRTRRDLHNLTNIVNIIAITMVLISSINIGVYELKRPTFTWDGYAQASEVAWEETGKHPDIYYIIVDAYGSAKNLEEFYDFDNSEFLNYLSDNGFYVASQSAYNHSGSHNSIASALNMRYLYFLRDELGETNDCLPVYEMLQNHIVWQLLKLSGYEYIHIGSRWDMTAINRHADVNINYSPSPEFYRFLFRATWAYPFAAKAHLVDDERLLHWKFALNQFEELTKIPNMRNNSERPVFVFAHIIIPHCPIVFDQDGSFLTIEQTHQRTQSENYLNQLIFTNKKLKTLIDEILSESKISPIIVIQGDHGPPGVWALSGHNALTSEDQLRLVLGILNAYHLPQGGADLLYDSITPINTFRLIFNYYFNADYDLLSDRSYLGKYVDVTELAQSD